MTPDQIQGAIGAIVGVPLLLWLGKLAWGMLGSNTKRIEQLELISAQRLTIIESLKDSIKDQEAEIKSASTLITRHDERLRNHDNDFKKLEDRFDRIDEKFDKLDMKIDMLLKK